MNFNVNFKSFILGYKSPQGSQSQGVKKLYDLSKKIDLKPWGMDLGKNKK